jgi:hypothetical protein
VGWARSRDRQRYRWRNRQRIGLIPDAEGGLAVRLHEDFGRLLQFCAAGEHKRPAPAVVDRGADYR